MWEEKIILTNNIVSSNPPCLLNILFLKEIFYIMEVKYLNAISCSDVSVCVLMYSLILSTFSWTFNRLLCVVVIRSNRGRVPSSAGSIWHHGGTGHTTGGESLRRTEEPRGFRSDDHALVILLSHGLMFLLLLHLTKMKKKKKKLVIKF